MHNIPSLDVLLDSHDPHDVPAPQYSEVEHDPIVILHSSGSTGKHMIPNMDPNDNTNKYLGVPKPITMTHATFAVLDRERYLPKTPGRKNRDYSIWDLEGGGRFYTVFPYFHVSHKTIELY